MSAQYIDIYFSDRDAQLIELFSLLIGDETMASLKVDQTLLENLLFWRSEIFDLTIENVAIKNCIHVSFFCSTSLDFSSFLEVLNQLRNCDVECSLFNSQVNMWLFYLNLKCFNEFDDRTWQLLTKPEDLSQ